MNKNILMICYYFPPLVDVGCKRSVAFSKYLKLHGWKPHVLSVQNPDKHYCLIGGDVPPENVPTTYVRSLFNVFWLFGKLNGILTRIFRCFGIRLQRNYLHDLFSIPDVFLGWIPGAILGGYRIIRRHEIACIYVSCSPFSSAIAGIVLKKITKLPLVIDFRDPLAVNIPPIFGLPGFRKKLNFSIEKKIINKSDLFIVNTEEIRKGFLDLYPAIAPKTVTIYNGFDHKEVGSSNLDKFNKFTIVYGGNMYFHANPSTSFFQALAKLKSESIINEKNFQFLYFGQDSSLVQGIADELMIADLVSVSSTIEHKQMVEILLRSHLQLLRIIKPMISTKLFEGIALNVPFLATIPEGEVADIIRKFCQSYYLLHLDSPDEIARAIISAMADYRQGRIENNRTAEFLASFSRENSTRKLEELLEVLLSGHSPSRVAAPVP